MNDILENLYEGFAAANADTMELLQKALTAGSGVDAGSFTGGRAMIPESLDQTLVNILHSQDEAVLFQRLKKQPVKSPVHQWNDRTEVGADDGAWVPEAGDSEEADQTINRRYVTMKYLQTLRKVSLQASISNMLEDAIALEKNAGTLWIVRNVEKALFSGNKALVAEQPDGLDALIPATNVKDLRGADATSASYEDAINEGCRTIRERYGKASLMLSSTMVMQDVQKLLRDRIRFEAKEGVLGSAVFSKYPTPFGTPELKEDIFISEGTTPSASSLTSKRAGVPSIGSITTPVDATALFGAAEAGDYIYKIVGVNRYGDSAATAATAAVTVAAGDNVTLPITNGSPASTAYKVYRGKKNNASTTDLRYAFTVAVTGSPMDVIDRNWYLPGCSSTYLLTMESVYDAIEWVQFLPLMKFDLYPTNAAVFPFLLVLFGALALKKPVQHYRLTNVAPANLGWF